MKIIIIELAGNYEYVDNIAKLFGELDIPDTVFVLVPKEAEVKLVDIVEV